MKELLSPLVKIHKLIENDSKKIDDIHSVLTVDLKKVGNDSHKELKKQSVLLGEIRDILKQQTLNATSNASSSKIKLPGLISGVGIGFTIVTMAAALVASAGLFSVMPSVSPAQLLTAVAIGAVFVILAPIFTEISESLRGGGIYERIVGKVTGTSSDIGGVGDMIKNVGGTGLAMLTMATSVTLASYIFRFMYTPSPVQLGMAALTGLALVPVAFAFSRFYSAMRRDGLGADKDSIKKIALTGVAMVAAVGSLIAITWLLTKFPLQVPELPPGKWILKAAITLTLFAIPFMLITRAVRGASLKELLFASVALPLIAGGILGVAWIFNYLAEVGTYNTPPLTWALKAGIVLSLFAIPFAIVGFLAQTLTPVGLALGAAGIVLLAGAMWAVAWIFSTLPDLSSISRNFTDALMIPVNAMIDTLKRLKDEIGISNLLPLAGGLLAISGSWLALTAALAGASLGGLLSGVGNIGSAILDGIAGLFGKDKAETPISLLDKLIARKDGIRLLADSMPKLGQQFAIISAHTNSVVRGIAAFMPFLDKKKSEYLTDSANASERLAKAYSKIGDATNDMNVEAIKESRYMFEALTKLADSGGEDTLTVFANKLMVAVKELSETVDNLQDAVGEQSTGIKDVISGLLSKVTDKVNEVTNGSPENTELSNIDEIRQMVEILGDIEDRLNTPLRVIPG